MKKAQFDRLVLAILPIAFIGSGFLNVVAYVFGLHNYDTARTLVTFGIIGITALILFCKVLLLWKEHPDWRRGLLYVSIISIVFVAVCIAALLSRGMHTFILKSLIVDTCYLVSSLCAVIIIACENRLRQFLHVCRIYALILAPISLYYCVRFYLPGAKQGTVENLGILSYMTRAYLCLNLCIFLAADLILFLTQKDAPHAKQWIICDSVLYGLFSVTIALSTCKGTILCLLFCNLLIVAFMLWTKRSFRKFPICSALLVVLFVSVMAPQYGAGNRVLGFLKELSPANSVIVDLDEIQQTTSVLPP